MANLPEGGDNVAESTPDEAAKVLPLPSLSASIFSPRLIFALPNRPDLINEWLMFSRDRITGHSPYRVRKGGIP